MFEIIFYRDSRGVEPVREFIDGLAAKQDKNSRVNYNKIAAYMRTLMVVGVAAGMPALRHIDGDIWELRPIDNRIMFAAWGGETFILLHHFPKKTQKTPQAEIDTAKRRLEEARATEKETR